MVSLKMSRWGDEKTIKFINLYRKHLCLWNVNSPLYKNKIARINAYRKIIEEMNDSNLTLTGVKAKIKGLRSTFHQELKKINKSKNSYISTLAWLKEMDFLKDAFENRGTIYTEVALQASTDSLEQARSSSQESTELLEPLRPSSQASIETLEQTKPNPDILAYGQPLNSNDRSKVSSKGTGQKRKRTKDEALNALKRLENIAARINTRYNKDEFYYFGLNVAAQLRALPLSNALDMQSKIQMLLSTERLQLDPGFSGYIE